MSTRSRLSPSVPSRLAAIVTGLGLRPVNSAIPLNPTGVWVARQMVAGFMAAFGPHLRGTQITPVRSSEVIGEWVTAPGVENGNRAIYYLHGSGYVLCSARTHRGLASRLSRATGLPVFLPDYRLAPEFRFPAAADDAITGYKWLLDQGFDASDVVVAGDSAGGHLALDLLIENRRTGIPQPAACVLFSPLVDPSFGLAAEQELRRRDPMITARAARDLVALYTLDQPADHPRLQLDLTGAVHFPPLLVQAGGAEMLSADARHLHRVITAAGGRCDLEIWPGQMHVFQALPLLVPEANFAIRRAARFIASSLADNSLTERQAG